MSLIDTLYMDEGHIDAIAEVIKSNDNLSVIEFTILMHSSTALISTVDKNTDRDVFYCIDIPVKVTGRQLASKNYKASAKSIAKKLHNVFKKHIRLH